MPAPRQQPAILITGGATFLGSKLTASLLEQNCVVTVIDNFEGELPDDISRFKTSPNLKIVRANISQEIPGNLGKFSYIYHLSGVEEHLKGTRPNHSDLLVNSQGTENLLQLAKEQSARFILVSTLDVYQGVISQTSLTSYFGTNAVNFAHFSHHEAKRFAESLTAAHFTDYGTDCVIARIAQIYGPGMNLGAEDVTARLIKQAVVANRLVIAGDGLEILHPTYIYDVVWGLVKAGFSHQTKGGIYNLVSPTEVTVLAFAQRLKELASTIDGGKILDVTFQETNGSIKFPIPKIELAKTEQDLGWAPRVTLQEGLKNTLEFFLKSKPESEDELKETVVQVSQEPEVSHTLPVEAAPAPITALPTVNLPKVSLPTFSLPTFFQKKNLALRTLILIVFILILVPFGQIVVGITFGFKNFTNAKSALFSADFPKATAKSAQARNSAKYASAGFKKLQPVFVVTGQKKLFLALNQNFEGINAALSGFENLVATGRSANVLAKGIVTGAQVDLTGETGQLNFYLSQSITNFETAQLNLADSKLERVSFFGKKLTGLTAELAQNLPNLKKTANFTKVIPDLVGFASQKSYLVLFENNSELRPGGGFIGSYGVFDFATGRMTEPFIDDVYNLDGQLKISIPPPVPLAQHLGTENWGLRDSGWHYDFTQNGALAASLYQQVTGKTVNGVIGLDVYAFSEILGVLGPIKLPDYEEEITAANLAERVEYYSEVGFFPGSTSKKDFLSALARQVFLKLRQGDGVNYFEIAKVLGAAAGEKHLNFYFTDPNLQATVADIGWTGQIKSISAQEAGQTKIVSDFLALSEANVGANKSNRFLERKIKITPVVLRDGDLITSLDIEYQNTSPAPTWPGGNYKNYLRIITPVATKLEQFKIGEEDVTPRVEQSADADKQIYAVFFEIPAGEKRKVTAVYRPNYRIQISGNSASYSLLVQKQPGTGADPVTIDLAYPAYLKTPSTNLPATLSEQKVVSEHKMLTDFTFKVEFSL